jgi:hypothetical protein
MDKYFRRLIAEFFVIIGSILLAIGIPYLIPNDDYWKRFMLFFGLILVLFGLLTILPEMRHKQKIRRIES